MKKDRIALRKKLLQKRDTLNRAKKQLKKEFIGINQIIDEIIDAVNPWYFFPDLQDKPVIINLWGLTGVGKTSLVKRLSELLGFKNSFFHFDLSDKENTSYKLYTAFREIAQLKDNAPVIIAFDEFQNARTVNQYGIEIGENENQIIWQILDSGKTQLIEYRNLSFKNIIPFWEKLLKNGVVVKNGKIIKKNKYFANTVKSTYSTKQFYDTYDIDNELFIPEIFYEDILELAKDKFDTIIDVREYLLSIDGNDSVKFLKRIQKIAESPEIINCSKSIIFTLGNLDEAYTMSGDFNADVNPDEFYENSKKISIPKIKEALQKRFRNEQIARLGNIHIIYPALSRKSYQKIIKLELKKISKMIFEKYQAVLVFERSVEKLIYKEGVYPTQGVRPVLTTIHQIIKTKIGLIFSRIIIKGKPVTTITIGYKKNKILLKYFNKEKLVDSFSIKQQTVLEKLRENKKNDLQAIAAVHEAGHAVAAISLLNTLPKAIFSTTSSVGSSGFTLIEYHWNYISKHEIIKRIAVLLAGFTAEKIIFGKERVIAGSSEDIKNATVFIMKMLKRNGMGEEIGTFNCKSPETKFYFFDDENKIEEEAKRLISKGMELAEKTLLEQKRLLLKISDYLKDNRKMDEKQIFKFAKKYSVNFNTNRIIKSGDNLFYRRHLIKKISELEGKEKLNSVKFSRVAMNQKISH